MKLNSKYFDSIRVAQAKREPVEEQEPRRCQWKGCPEAGPHRAPKGRGREGEYFFFCLDHVRRYNASYNYFDGMSDAEVDDFRKDAVTGHRPTWNVGLNLRPGGEGAAASGRTAPFTVRANDPHGFFAYRRARAGGGEEPPRRKLKPLEKRSLETMNLHETATKEEIKARFKQLVKQHHPDSNGGDNRSEDRLREIIQAYNYLKQAGLV